MNWRLLSALVVLMSVVVGSAWGGYVVPSQGDYLKFVGSAYGGDDQSYPDAQAGGTSLWGQNPGGEFKFEVYSASGFVNVNNPGTAKGYFVTFCAQTGEYISYGSFYRYDSDDPDVDDFAKWIYHGYLTKEESVNYSVPNIVPDRAKDTGNPVNSHPKAAKIQEALWKALGLNPSYGWITAGEYALWQGAYAQDVSDSIWPASAFIANVAVLKTLGGNPAQDQFVYISGTGDVPEPVSLLIWSVLGLGSAGLAMWSRRRRNGLALAGSVRWSHEDREAILALIERGRRT